MYTTRLPCQPVSYTSAKCCLWWTTTILLWCWLHTHSFHPFTMAAISAGLMTMVKNLLYLSWSTAWNHLIWIIPCCGRYIYMYTRWDALGCFNNMFHSKCRFEPSSKYLVCCEIMFTFVRISWQYNFCHIMWWARWKCKSPSKTHYLLFFTYSEWIGKYITEWREFQPAGQWWATVNFRCYRGVYSPQKF